MTLAYLLCYKIFGQLAFGFHLMNLVLHVAIVLLLFIVTDHLFQDSLLALIVAGLFALHPIHTESVGWIAGITDLDLSFFFLLPFLLYLRLVDTGRETIPRAMSYVAMVLAYCLALLSKEQALVFPALAVVYEHFYRPVRSAGPLFPSRLLFPPPLPSSRSSILFFPLFLS